MRSFVGTLPLSATLAAATLAIPGLLATALRGLLRRLGSPRSAPRFDPLNTATLRDIGLGRLELRAWPAARACEGAPRRELRPTSLRG